MNTRSPSFTVAEGLLLVLAAIMIALTVLGTPTRTTQILWILVAASWVLSARNYRRMIR